MLIANAAPARPLAVLQSTFSYQAQALAPQAEAGGPGESSQPGCLVQCTVHKHSQVGNQLDSSCESPAFVFLHSFPKLLVSSTVKCKVSRAENKVPFGPGPRPLFLFLCEAGSAASAACPWDLSLAINKEPFIRLLRRLRPGVKIRAFS